MYLDPLPYAPLWSTERDTPLVQTEDRAYLPIEKQRFIVKLKM